MTSRRPPGVAWLIPALRTAGRVGELGSAASAEDGASGEAVRRRDRVARRSVNSMADRCHPAAMPADGRHAVTDLPPAVIESEVAEQGGRFPVRNILGFQA